MRFVTIVEWSGEVWTSYHSWQAIFLLGMSVAHQDCASMDIAYLPQGQFQSMRGMLGCSLPPKSCTRRCCWLSYLSCAVHGSRACSCLCHGVDAFATRTNGRAPSLVLSQELFTDSAGWFLSCDDLGECERLLLSLPTVLPMKERAAELHTAADTRSVRL